jgi:hypothetical protein
MPKRSGSSIFWEDTYVRLTHRPLNSLVFILAPLVIYHYYALRYGTPLLAPRDVGRVLGYFGASAAILPPLLVVAVLLAQQVVSHCRWRPQPLALCGMLLESFVWVPPLMGISYITTRLMLAADVAGAELVDVASQPSAFAQSCLQALGAGIYEEFLFRLGFVGLTIFLLTRVKVRRDLADVVAILAGAVLFSLYHFSNEQFAPGGFPWSQFVFRTLAGVYLGGLYVCRGFGIVVGAHAVWNVWVAYLSS